MNWEMEDVQGVPVQVFPVCGVQGWAGDSSSAERALHGSLRSLPLLFFLQTHSLLPYPQLP